MYRGAAYNVFQRLRTRAGYLQVRRYVTPVSNVPDYHTDRVRPVLATHAVVDVESFRLLAWDPAIPVHLQGFHRLPAMENWISARDLEKRPASFASKLEAFSDTIVSYELIVSSSHGDTKSSGCSPICLRKFEAWLGRTPVSEQNRSLQTLISQLLKTPTENGQSRFLQFDAPLGLIMQASRYNRGQRKSSQRISQLYIAQSEIRSLPSDLADDLPVPDIVSQVGKGDIYGSSIWLGLQPTYTPLHRDPNPNLFCQLAGWKAVRLLRPEVGQSVFEQVRRSLGTAVNSRFRGPEMMHGPERDRLHRAIWGEPDGLRDIWQATVSPGDALFIPQGWWHSIRSVGYDAELNASANWWFR
ncbi:hypothetical protein NPX13_g9687 [Xylaria arbuscula]|uniref:JmjC domain-containing protein n=1 Tax=Xylaria arbuscula TaxID=114810 RepID=A0A9W8N5Y4_9PEZI|nr:hypothetical protein NPX13_g9687 [Xylaria arbuscula]